MNFIYLVVDALNLKHSQGFPLILDACFKKTAEDFLAPLRFSVSYPPAPPTHCNSPKRLGPHAFVKSFEDFWFFDAELI